MRNNLSVLLADETGEQSGSIAQFLRLKGFNVSECGKDGAALLKSLENSTPDVILMDSFLMHIDAIGVVTRLNSMNPAIRPLVIVMSSIDNSYFEKEIMKLGVDYFFLKPIDSEIMAERIIQLSGWKHIGLVNSVADNENIEVVISKILYEIGVPAHIKGYQFLRNAIKISAEKTEMLSSITKKLYPTVAKEFSTTPTRVERAIRHAIEIAWDRGDADVLNDYFGYTVRNERGKPTNSEFIAMITDRIRLNIRRSS